MNLYKDAKKEYEKDKRKRLSALKRRLWWKGSKPKEWEYDYMDERWKAFYAVDDMEAISQLDTYASGKVGDVYFQVSYFENGRRRYSDAFYNWSDVKRFIGKRIIEK